MKTLWIALSLASLSLTSVAVSQQKATSLDQLLQLVIRDKKRDNAENRAREKTFLSSKNKQAAILARAKANLRKEKARGEALKKSYDANDIKLSQLETKLKLTLGTLGELFGVVRQVAGDTKGVFETSLVTAQYPGREKFVDELSTRKQLPNSEDLHQLWIELLTEMTESGKVQKFSAQVTTGDGSKEQKEVTRVGVFNLVSDGSYLTYKDEVKEIVELGRQPQGRFLSLVSDFESGTPGKLYKLGIDPSRGNILSALVQEPSLIERFHQGGEVGYVIAGVLIVGLLIVMERFVFLGVVGRKVRAQLKSSKIDKSNPLGMVFATYEENKSRDIESLELKLDEAVLKGTSKIERGLSTIKLLSSVAPLLGLLGTVVGMIGTFQSMMLFGTGDPKIMAGGISQALVTTVLGLVAAIPLVLLHSFVSNKCKGLLSVIEEQSIGLMAKRSEEGGQA